jgi:hypothetical protein
MFPDDGGSTHLWNVDLLQQDYTLLYPRKSQKVTDTTVVEVHIGSFIPWSNKQPDNMEFLSLSLSKGRERTVRKGLRRRDRIQHREESDVPTDIPYDPCERNGIPWGRRMFFLPTHVLPDLIPFGDLECQKLRRAGYWNVYCTCSTKL